MPNEVSSTPQKDGHRSRGGTQLANELPNENQFMVQWQRTWNAEFSLAEKIQLIALELLDGGRSALPSGLEQWKIIVLMGLLAKTIKSFRALILLVQHGLTADANGLLRTLFLTWAVIRWICNEPSEAEERARRYIEICFAQERRFRNAARSNRSLQDLLCGEMGQSLEDFINSMVERHGEEGVAQLAQECPWKSDEHVARVSDLLVGYDLLYRRTSQTLHAQDITEHVWIDPASGNIVVNAFPTERMGQGQLTLGFKTLLLVLIDFDRAIGCNMEHALNLVQQCTDELWARQQNQGVAAG